MSHLHHKVSALIDGELQGAARKRALNHLRICADCQHEVRATLALKHRLTGMQEAEPSPDLFASLEAVTLTPLDDETDQFTISRQVRRLLVGAGSVSVAVLALAYVVGAPDNSVEASVTPPLDEANANLASGGATTTLADPAIDALVMAVGGGAVATATTAKLHRGRSEGGSRADGGASSASTTIGPGPGDDPRALAALSVAARRPDVTAYQLVRRVENVTSDSRSAVSVRVVHVPGQGTSYQVLGGVSPSPVFVGAGSTRVSIRDAVQRVRLLESTYDIGFEGYGRVDSRPATIVSVGHQGALVARLWIDHATGILLRRDLYDQGMLVRSSVVTWLHTADRAFIPHLPPAIEPTATAPIARSSAAELGAAGWTCPASLLPGLSLTSLGRLEHADGAMVAQYSDGLSTVSIYEQRGDLDADSLSGYQAHELGDTVVYLRYGLPTVAVWQSGDMVYTAATDLPEQEVARLVDGLPHESAAYDPGMWTRVGTGLSRMAGFVSPGH